MIEKIKELSNQIVLEPEHHIYHYKDKKLPSVTQLLRGNGLTPNFDGVNSHVLKYSQEYGTEVHKVIEDYINDKEESVLYEDELNSFKKWYNQWVGDSDLEVITEVKTEYNGIAGMIDLLYKKDGKYGLIDWKTTSSEYNEHWRYQLSCYKCMLEKRFGIKIDYLNVVHINKNNYNITEVDIRYWSSVEELLENGYLSQNQLLPEEQLRELENKQEQLANIELQKKQIEEQIKDYREKLKNAMKDADVKSFETDKLMISYVSASERVGIDSKRLKEEMPEVARKYEKITQVNDSVRVKLKGEK